LLNTRKQKEERFEMTVVKYILIAIDIVVCLAMIIITTMQTKDTQGASGTITGSTTNNFYEKNKGRTREGMLKRWTIILGVIFAILSVAIGIVYVL